MRVFATVLTVSLLAAASVQAETRVSDEDYLRMARCAGLMAGARRDVSALDTALRDAGEGRSLQVRDAGRSRRRSAEMQMRGSDGEGRTRLETEISARCAAPAA